MTHDTNNITCHGHDWYVVLFTPTPLNTTNTKTSATPYQMPFESIKATVSSGRKKAAKPAAKKAKAKAAVKPKAEEKKKRDVCNHLCEAPRSR